MEMILSNETSFSPGNLTNYPTNISGGKWRIDGTSLCWTILKTPGTFWSFAQNGDYWKFNSWKVKD